MTIAPKAVAAPAPMAGIPQRSNVGKASPVITSTGISVNFEWFFIGLVAYFQK